MKSHCIKHLFGGLAAMVLGLAAVAGFGAVVMLLWNTLVPGIFGLAVLNFWQALGLLVLARLFFGSFGGKHRMAAGMHAHAHHHHHNHLREKWMNMTREERCEFIRNRHKRGFDADLFPTDKPEKEQ
jgi:hypothetical protein